MPGLSASACLGQKVTRLRSVLGRKFFDRLQLAIELEAEVVQRLLQHQRSMFSARIVNQLRLAAGRVAAVPFHRYFGSFAPGARYFIASLDISSTAGHCAPALPLPRLTPPRRSL